MTEINDLWNGSAPSTQPTQENYTFATGDFSDYEDFAAEIAKPKQEYANVEPNEQEQLGEQGGGVVNKAIAQNTAKFLTNNIDRVMSFTLAIIAADDIGEIDWGADQEEKDEIQQYMAACFPEGGKQIPPAAALIIALVLIYGLKVKDAIAYRKAHKQIAEQNETIKQQAEELEQLRSHIQELEAEPEQETEPETIVTKNKRKKS